MSEPGQRSGGSMNRQKLAQGRINRWGMGGATCRDGAGMRGVQGGMGPRLGAGGGKEWVPACLMVACTVVPPPAPGRAHCARTLLAWMKCGQTQRERAQSDTLTEEEARDKEA